MDLFITPEQLAALGHRILNEWGDYGYTVIGLRSRSDGVAVATVHHFDGSEFDVAVDRWCNPWEEGVP